MPKPATNQARRRRSRSRSKVKYKAGKITRNPFLNFLREFRKNSKGMKLTELTKRGAEIWRSMNQREKSPYCSLARKAPARRSRRGSRRSRRRRKSVRRNRRSRSHSVIANERKNRIVCCPKDDDVVLPDQSTQLKIIELPPDKPEDSDKPLEVIDLT